jgi:SAM-dependent methyltransferase
VEAQKSDRVFKINPASGDVGESKPSIGRCVMSASIKEHNLRAAALWGSGGRAYDRISRSVSGAIEHCVDRLNPRRGERIADIATGTGWTSRVVAQLGAQVVGFDIAEPLLDAAREIALEQKLVIDYRLGDAEALPVGDGEFDAVISTFGVMFAPDQQHAASELARICRSGGRLAIAAHLPDGNAVKMRQVLQPYAPTPVVAPPSPFVWGMRDWLTTTLGRDFSLGFEEGVVLSRFASSTAAWDAYTEGFGPVRAVAESLDEARKNELRTVFVTWVDQFRTGLGVSIPIQYLLTIGHRV